MAAVISALDRPITFCSQAHDAIDQKLTFLAKHVGHAEREITRRQLMLSLCSNMCLIITIVRALSDQG